MASDPSVASEPIPAGKCPGSVRFGLASWTEVARWAAVAAAVAAALLTGVALLAGHDQGDATAGLASSLLATHHDFGNVWFVFQRNLLVLAIHLCACWIGGIVARQSTPVGARVGRMAALHGPVPARVGRAAVRYALLVTLVSVLVQALALGHELANLYVATAIPRRRLLWLLLPHTAPELIAVFLPLGLFFVQARRGRLDYLERWSLQAGALALPVLFTAALIETFVTPARLLAASPFHLAAAVSILRPD